MVNFSEIVYGTMIDGTTHNKENHSLLNRGFLQLRTIKL